MTDEEVKMLERRWSSCKYLPEYDDALIEHLSKGYSFMSFTVGAGVSYGTLINWCKRFPSFCEAREIGEKARLRLLEEEGLKMVRGGNVVAWKFMMNQLGLTEKVEVQQTESVSPHMQVNAPIRYARLQKLKELNQRVRLEEKSLEGEVIDVEADDDLDLL